MSIQGWVMCQPSKTAATIMLRAGRVNSSWENTYRNANITPLDTAIPGGSRNGGLGYTITLTDLFFKGADNSVIIPNAPAPQTIDDLDDDLADCFRFFQVGGLTAGGILSGYINIDTRANYNTRVPFIYKTLPDGEVSKGYGSCMGREYSFDLWPDKGDYGHWFKPVRELIQLKIDYFSFIDDAMYTGFAGTIATVTAPWAYPINISNDSPMDNTGTGGVGPSGKATYLNGGHDMNGSAEQRRHYLCQRQLFSCPAFQLLGQFCPIVVVPGDHDFMPGNDWDHAGRGGVTDPQEKVDVWAFGKEHWDRTYGRMNLATNSSAPNTPVYPKGLTDDDPDPVTAYGVNPDNYKPTHFVIETDYVSDYHPDFLTHRSAVDYNGAGATLLGTTQLSDLKTAITNNNKGGSNDKRYTNLSMAKQLMSGMVNNTDGYCSSIQWGNSTNGTARAEREDLVAHGKTADRVISSTCGDSHYLQAAEDGNWLENNVAGISRGNSSSGQQQTSSTSPALDDLFAGTEIATEFSGDHVSNWSDGVAYDGSADPFSLPDGFGYSRFTKDRAYHVMLDSRGYVVGGVAEVYPYTKSINATSSLILEQEVSVMEKISYTLTAGTSSLGVGFGLDQLDGELSDDFPKIKIGFDTGDGFFAALRGVYDSTGAKQPGFGVVFTVSETAGVDNSPNPADHQFPNGLKITVSETDGSNPDVLQFGDIDENAPSSSGSRRFIKAGGGLYNNGAGLVDGTDYLVTIEYPAQGTTGVGGGTLTFSDVGDDGYEATQSPDNTGRTSILGVNGWEVPEIT